MQVLGSCSICGGEVTCPTAWWSIVPPRPMCSNCGAVAAPGPVIPMTPATVTTTATTNQIVLGKATTGGT